MAEVVVKDLVKRFGSETLAVDNVSFTVGEGEFVTLLGPSGCGKTTTLRCIAGLETPDEGDILIANEVFTSSRNGVCLPPEKRRLGMVFQSYAIWPHMSVSENVAYGIQAQGASRAEVNEKVVNALELVGLGGLGERNATKLSGGQQQRVSLARALAYNPRVLLFDEPLSNLDAKLRERMRIELANLIKELKLTAIYVTHDQAEAMVMSDRIIVMKRREDTTGGRPARHIQRAGQQLRRRLHRRDEHSRRQGRRKRERQRPLGGCALSAVENPLRERNRARNSKRLGFACHRAARIHRVWR